MATVHSIAGCSQDLASCRLRGLATKILGVLLASLLLPLLILPAPVVAAVPKMLNYQGRMTDSSDNLIDGTTYYYQFEIYDDPTAGNLLWGSHEDFHSTCGVAITPSKGVFNTIIGDDTVNNMSDLDIDFDTNPYYLLIKISATQSNNVACEGTLGAGASYESLSPRQRIVSSGYAFTARELSGDYGEEITNPSDDILALSGVSGGDNTDVYFNLDGTYPIIYSNTDSALGIDDDLIFVGAQAITTSTGNLSLTPAGNLTINTTGGTVLVDDNLDVDGAGPHDIANTLNTDTLVVDTLLDVNEDIDIDLDAADEEVRLTQSAVAGTEYPGSGDPTGLFFIDDNRTGATTDEIQEATLVFDSEGTYALAVLDGNAYFEDIVYLGSANTYFNASGALVMGSQLITDIGATGTDFTTGGGLTLAGAFIANGAVTLGDGGDDIAINSNDWDISGAGVGSGFTQFTVDNLQLDGNTLTTTTGNLTLDSNDGTTQVNDNLDVVGNTTSTAGYADFGSYLRASEIRSEGNLYANYDGADGDSYLYFYDNSSPTTESLMWDDVSGYGDGAGFHLSDDFELEGNIRKSTANLSINASSGTLSLQTGGTDKVTVSANGDMTLNNTTYGFMTFGELASAPTGAAARQYYNTTNDMMYYYDGNISGWRSMQGVSTLFLAPEYPNAVTACVSGSCTGTLTTGYDLVGNILYTFYKWEGTVAGTNIDFGIHLKMPDNFVSWASTAITFNYKTESNVQASNYVDWYLYEDGNGTALCSATSLYSSTGGTWYTDSFTTGGCANLSNLTAGDTFFIRIRLNDNSGAEDAAYAGKVTLFYR